MGIMKEINELVENCISEFFHLNESARIQHAEDLIFWEGSKGALRSVKSIMDLNRGGHKNLTIKWDGSPAVIFGRNTMGQFILTDKGGFTVKSYDGKSKSGEELERMFLNRGNVQEKSDEYKKFAREMRNLFPIFESAVPKDFRGYFKGDLLYLTKPPIIDGNFVFTPNVVTYRVSTISDLGKGIEESKCAVVIHRKMDETGNEYPLKDTKIFQGNDLLVIPPVTVISPPNINVNGITAILNLIKSNASSIDSMLDSKTISSIKLSDLPEVFYSYINSKVDTGMDKLGSDFFKWLNESTKVSDIKKRKISEYLSSHKNGFISMWKIISEIIELKDEIISQLENQESPVKATIGTHKGGEGYVLSHPHGDIKFVSRSGFSAANRSLRRESSLNEGGNVFKSKTGIDTIRINRSDVEPTVRWLEYITGLDLLNNMLGTTGKNSTSGDLDLAVDEVKISKEKMIDILTKWAIKNAVNPAEYIKKSGDSVHFKTPINGHSKNGFVQTDFMFGDSNWLRWSMKGGKDNSKYKGMHRHVLLASIAKYKNLRWSYKNGIVDRESGVTVTKDPDRIAKILLGDDAESSDLDYFETILDKIKNNPNYEKIVSDARETLIRYGIEF